MIRRFQQIYTTVISIGMLALFCSSAFAENTFDADSGVLTIPVLKLNESQSYTLSFSLVSSEPLIWAVDSYALTAVESRTAATYSAESGTLNIPELYVQGQLYSLTFQVTGNCDAEFCLEPDLASVAQLGRSGAQVFSTSLSSGNTFSCANCHALSETNGIAADGFRRAGHPLMNSTKREHYKNGTLTEMLDAVNTCVTEWMSAQPWTATDTDWINLRNWLDDMSDVATAQPVVIDIISPPSSLSGGDETAGHELFNNSCSVCHGMDGVGTTLAPKITNIGLEADFIADKVRTSGRKDSSTYSGLTGGIMPFWGADRLTDDELLDIIAWLESGQVDDVTLADDSDDQSTSNCSSTHFRVGQTATLSQLDHNVSGTVTVIDDCTLKITGFNYDGGGIDVRVYLARNGNFSNGGFAVTGDLLGAAYVNATLTITLPAGITLDDFDSISIWCVDVKVSFGDGVFLALDENSGVDISY